MARKTGIAIGAAVAAVAVVALGAVLVRGLGEPGSTGQVAAPVIPVIDPVGPAAPTRPETCAAANCFEIAFSPELQEALSEGVSLDEFIEGLSFAYRGEAPLRAYLVVARYNEDRMVRYNVSPPLTVAPGAVDIAEAETVLRQALGPRTERGLIVSTIAPDLSATDPALPAAGFVGSMPSNTLSGLFQPGLEEPPSVAERRAMAGVGVIALIPRDAELREEPQGVIHGAVVRLTYY